MSNCEMCVNTPIGAKTTAVFQKQIKQIHDKHTLITRSEETNDAFIPRTNYIKPDVPVDLIALGVYSSDVENEVMETDEVDPTKILVTSYLIQLDDPTKKISTLMAVSVTNGRCTSSEESEHVHVLRETAGVPLKQYYCDTNGTELTSIYDCVKPENGISASMSIRINMSAVLDTKTSTFNPHFDAEFYLDGPLTAKVVGYTLAYQATRHIAEREAEYERNNHSYHQVVNFYFDPSKPDVLELQEDCDNHFSEDLNKKEVKELIDWLQGVHDRMEDEDE